MLALTENVTDIVKKLAEEVPEISALRIATESDGESLSVSPADHAESDDQVIEHLVRVKGIGRWTAEMVLMFTLGRPDVWPVDDLGLRVAVQEAYGLAERPGKAELERIGAPWSPWRSVASFYLWRSRRV